MEDAIERGLAFVEICAREDDVHAMVKEFQSRIRDFGFTACAGGGWVGVGRNRYHRFYFNDWPADWMELYARENFFEDDPFVMESRRRMSPFTLRELEGQPHMTARGREIYDHALAYGWREALGIPLHGPGGYQGFVSLATLKDIVIGMRERSVLQAMATSIHDRCRFDGSFGAPSSALPKLTRRELECLQWAALGKTDWEIGQLLGVTESTAHFHIERAKKKLNVTSRVQAVALLVLHGLV